MKKRNVIYIYIYFYSSSSTKRRYKIYLHYSIRPISKNFDTQGIIINVAQQGRTTLKNLLAGDSITFCAPIILELIERTKYICTHVKYTTFKHSRDILDGRKIWRRSFFFFFFYTFVYVGELARPWTQKRPPRFLKTYVYKLCMKQRP